MVFQLSNAVIQGLKNLDGIFSDELSKKLIANCVKLILNPSGTITPFPELYYDQQGDRAKQSEYAVTTVFALSTRHLCDSNVLRNILQKYEISQNVVNEIVRVYEEHSKEMILRQLQLGHNHPHITELQWRIVCDVKSTTMHQSSGEVGFQINLGRYANGPDGGQRETIAEFICNTEELQSFINKLKEIERHCEKLTLE